MSFPTAGSTGLWANTSEITPLARIALYFLTTLLVISAVEPGWTAAIFVWFALGLLTLTLRAIEEELTPLAWRVAVALPGTIVLLLLDAAGGAGSRSSRAILAAALVAVGLLIAHAVYPAGITGPDGAVLLGAAFHLGWLDWQAATIGLLATFGSFGLFAAALLVRNRPLAHEAVPFSPFIYLGLLSGIALT